MRGKLIDLTGQRFGRWTVIERAGSDRYRTAVVTLWLCRCDCGTEAIVRGQNLRSGRSLSCGCLRDERVAEAAKEMHRKREEGKHGE